MYIFKAVDKGRLKPEQNLHMTRAVCFMSSLAELLLASVTSNDYFSEITLDHASYYSFLSNVQHQFCTVIGVLFHTKLFFLPYACILPSVRCSCNWHLASCCDRILPEFHTDSIECRTRIRRRPFRSRRCSPCRTSILKVA